MADRAAMEVLRLFFLQVDPCPICESLWLALHILDSLAVLELLAEPLLPAYSCRIENSSLVDSWVHGPGYCFFSCSSFAFDSLILVSISFISCSRSVLSASSSFL